MRYDFLTIPELAIELGARAKDFRLGKRMDQAEVADLAGISVRTVRFLEQGRGSSVDTLLRVMKALGVLGNLDLLFPAAPTIDPVALLRGPSAPRRIYKKRGPRA